MESRMLTKYQKNNLILSLQNILKDIDSHYDKTDKSVPKVEIVNNFTSIIKSLKTGEIRPPTRKPTQSNSRVDYLIGDANGDGQVDIADFLTIINLIGSTEWPLEADVNFDGILNILDANIVLGYMQGNVVFGCTDDTASNYNSDATHLDGAPTGSELYSTYPNSCEYEDDGEIGWEDIEGANICQSIWDFNLWDNFADNEYFGQPFDNTTFENSEGENLCGTEVITYDFNNPFPLLQGKVNLIYGEATW
jgi:hypothetical protein